MTFVVDLSNEEKEADGGGSLMTLALESCRGVSSAFFCYLEGIN